MATHPYHFGEKPFIKILDDVTAWSVIESLGFIEHFLRQEREGTLAKNITALIAEHHPTHWVVCMRFANYPDKTDNGFMIEAYRKPEFDLQQLRFNLRSFIESGSDIEGRWVFPEQNS